MKREPEKTKDLIQIVLGSYGLDDKDHLISDEPGRCVYGLQRGSAQVFLILSYDDSETWLQVISPICGFPASTRREQCFQWLLELNATELINCSFCIENDKICVNSDRSTNNLQAEEIREMVLCVSKFADDYDDEMFRRFACPRLGD